MRLVNAQEGGNATSVIVATPFDTFTASGIIASTVGQLGGGNQSAVPTYAAGGDQSAGGTADQQQGRRNQSAGPGSKWDQRNLVEVRSPHTSWEETGT